MCLGFEPGAAGWNSQTNPLSFGSPLDAILSAWYKTFSQSVCAHSLHLFALVDESTQVIYGQFAEWTKLFQKKILSVAKNSFVVSILRPRSYEENFMRTITLCWFIAFDWLVNFEQPIIALHTIGSGVNWLGKFSL